MGLIGNRTLLHRINGSRIGGFLSADVRLVDNWHVREGANQLSSVPDGYKRGWVLPQKNGGVSIYNSLDGSNNINLSLSAGINVEGYVDGQGSITEANLALVVGAIATLSQINNLSATVVGKLELASTLAQSNNLSGALRAIAFSVAEITNQNTLVGDNGGTKAFVSATFSSSSLLSPENLAQAVWNSIASQYQVNGTMGKIMNSIGASNDPWSTELPSTYVGSQAGAIMAKIQTLVDELHKIQGLDQANPMTVTPDSRIVGDIELEITGDGETSTTVTRI
jgi:predicted component of type VI protein secretion system